MYFPVLEARLSVVHWIPSLVCQRGISNCLCSVVSSVLPPTSPSSYCAISLAKSYLCVLPHIPLLLCSVGLMPPKLCVTFLPPKWPWQESPGALHFQLSVKSLVLVLFSLPARSDPGNHVLFKSFSLLGLLMLHLVFCLLGGCSSSVSLVHLPGVTST